METSWTTSTITSDLRQIGLRDGDTLLVHSSFKSLGPGTGGPQAVVQALLDSVGPTGTVLFPTHTWANAGPSNPPIFDVRNTPSAQVGILAETARCWPGAVRSLHPTHSVVAIGSEASYLTNGHFNGGICGIGSPYDRLCECPRGRGFVLLLGVDHERNTSLHMVEELLRIPGALKGKAVCRVKDYDGTEYLRESKFHSWQSRTFMVLDHDLDRESIQIHGRIGEARVRLVDANKLREFALDKLREDPSYFWTKLPT